MDPDGAPDLDGLRSLLGETAAAWAGDAVVRADRWSAISGASSVDYNVVVCHSGEDGCVAGGLDELLAAKVPGVVMLAGPALGHAQTLAGAGWVCIGSTAFMELVLPASWPTSGGSRDRAQAGVSARCGAERLPAARALIQEAFALEPEHALVALPPDAVDGPAQSVWI
ncbi:MAG: hypothetical protein ACRDL5_02260, partial [Solirubrobacteraceae bacterium]